MGENIFEDERSRHRREAQSKINKFMKKHQKNTENEKKANATDKSIEAKDKKRDNAEQKEPDQFLVFTPTRTSPAPEGITSPPGLDLDQFPVFDNTLKQKQMSKGMREPFTGFRIPTRGCKGLLTFPLTTQRVL